MEDAILEGVFKGVRLVVAGNRSPARVVHVSEILAHGFRTGLTAQAAD
jgi:hypothetical protein